MPDGRMPDGASIAEQWAAGGEAAWATHIAEMDEARLRAIAHDWAFWGRAGQLPPAGEDWRIWLMMAGRGFGKTRAGAEWVRSLAERDGRLRIALVAATMAEGRQVMIEGESGLMGISPRRQRPVYEPSLRRLRWPSGAVATLYSAAEAESLRGAQHHFAWADEVAKWPDGLNAWDNLVMGLRLGKRPRVLATTTPRPVALVRRLIGQKGVVRTGGRTRDNRGHLPRFFLDSMADSYGGTRLGRQELDGELIEDIEGALWSRALIEACRVTAAPEMARVVIGVDPPGSETGDACGIIAVGLGRDGHAYVLGDASVAHASPETWAQAVARAAQVHGADRVIAEKNMGGDMVESVLRGSDAALPIRLVHASRGKTARAEPVAALYERGKAHHLGAFPALEDEMAGLLLAGGYHGPGRSPDRADALVWAMTELMLGRRGEPSVRVV